MSERYFSAIALAKENIIALTDSSVGIDNLVILENAMLAKKGACLCGAVHISAEIVKPNVGACHCSICRKWAGSPFLGVDCGSDVSFEGAENITTFSSSDWAERGFCNKCGTHLFYRLKQNNQYFVPSGLFEDSEGFVFDHQIFIDEKPPFYSFANETKNMTGAEVFAQFTAPEA